MKPSWEKELLKSAKIIHFATLKEDGAPALRPINFLYEKGRIYIHTGPKSGKIAQIQRDPRVCLEVEQILKYIPAVDRPCTATYSCRSVVVEGIARLVLDNERKRNILQGMMKKYQPAGGYRPVSLEDAKITAIIEVVVRDISGKDHLRE
jgi:nitroimidazol reductase NimA-like FMN-containing flavoprotein (pyridoxamine 5'-phosphate oxidase superfamily)